MHLYSLNTLCSIKQKLGQFPSDITDVTDHQKTIKQITRQPTSVLFIYLLIQSLMHSVYISSQHITIAYSVIYSRTKT